MPVPTPRVSIRCIEALSVVMRIGCAEPESYQRVARVAWPTQSTQRRSVTGAPVTSNSRDAIYLRASNPPQRRQHPLDGTDA